MFQTTRQWSSPPANTHKQYIVNVNHNYCFCICTQLVGLELKYSARSVFPDLELNIVAPASTRRPSEDGHLYDAVQSIEYNEMPEDERAPYAEPDQDERSIYLRRMPLSEDPNPVSTEVEASPDSDETTRSQEESQSTDRVVPASLQMNLLTWKTGVCVISAFLMSFITIMVIRGLLKSPPRSVSLFANLYLAGTIIFGGGPVVIPLLRKYIVAEGWVSPRDFLLGLALIQSFPGPNFNLAIYLGSLATARTSLPSFSGALIGFIGIFTLGIIIVIGIMGLWSVLRSHRWLLSLLRGINARAVRLGFTAVYKLWQIGYVDVDNQGGGSPWKRPMVGCNNGYEFRWRCMVRVECTICDFA